MGNNLTSNSRVLNNGIRDVYFARILGASPDIENNILEVDKKMGCDMHNGKLWYCRVSELPKLSSHEDIDFYSSLYDKYQNDRANFALKKFQLDDRQKEIVFAAIKRVIELYKENKKNASESIIRNFSIKLLFWLDTLEEGLFGEWDEKKCIKIIAENIIKEHEYLFFYFLTQVGCDVLLLELEKDVEVTGRLKELSQIISHAAFSKMVIPTYKKYVPEQKQDTIVRKTTDDVKENNTKNENGRIKIVLPERSRGSRPAANPQTEKSESLPVRKQSVQGLEKNNEKREKTYEELARLASSIVLIAVHDENGEVNSTGSGIMIGQDGFILTNNHVISGGRYFSIKIEDDDKIYKTDEVIKYNTNLDLAVIRIRRKLNPLPIYRGKQKLVRGQKVVAIGSPLGLFNSVSDGIISGFRTIRNEDMIQFTAPISHGSSGGAVLNMYGEVIGISTAGIDEGQNLNLAMGYESILFFAKGFC